jgi:uncharacterized membrane protein YkvA (DUF1232 family)
VFTGLVVAYAFSPTDLIPDFIPVLGYLDALELVSISAEDTHKMISPEEKACCLYRTFCYSIVYFTQGKILK